MAAETLAVFVRAVLVDQFFELTSRQGFHYFGKSGISIHVAGLVLFESSTRSLSPKPWPATLSATPPNLFRTAVRLRGDDGNGGMAVMTGWRDGGMAGWRDGGMAGWRDGGTGGMVRDPLTQAGFQFFKSAHRA